MTIPGVGRASVERSFGAAEGMQVKHVGNMGTVRCIVLHFEPSALVEWRAENSQVSLAQLQKGESTDVHQMQGLGILANCAQPKRAVGAFVIPEVSGSRIAGIQGDFALVVDCLAWVFDIKAKVRDVVLNGIFVLWCILNGEGSFDRASD
jgi:hypothetical protein